MESTSVLSHGHTLLGRKACFPAKKGGARRLCSYLFCDSALFVHTKTQSKALCTVPTSPFILGSWKVSPQTHKTSKFEIQPLKDASFMFSDTQRKKMKKIIQLL